MVAARFPVTSKLTKPVGGKPTRRGLGKTTWTNKTTVFGMVRARQRQAVRWPRCLIRTGWLLERTIARNVAPGSTISTDEWRAYGMLAHSPYTHGAVNHKAERMCAERHNHVHTNSIEGHWSQLKRAIRGTHIHVSAKHLWKYVSEFTYRRNSFP